MYFCLCVLFLILFLHCLCWAFFSSSDKEEWLITIIKRIIINHIKPKQCNLAGELLTAASSIAKWYWLSSSRSPNLTTWHKSRNSAKVIFGGLLEGWSLNNQCDMWSGSWDTESSKCSVDRQIGGQAEKWI